MQNRNTTGAQVGILLLLMVGMTLGIFYGMHYIVSSQEPPSPDSVNGAHINVSYEKNPSIAHYKETHITRDEKVASIYLVDGEEQVAKHEFERFTMEYSRVSGYYTVVAVAENGTKLERVEPERGEDS